MSVTFDVSPDVSPPRAGEAVDHAALLRQAFRRPVEALWRPSQPLVACGEDHALLTAVHEAFYCHHPLILSPDVIWLTLARGFALHVNLHAEELRDRFVRHEGKEKIIVERPDFLPGRDNPWPEAFEAFSLAIGKRIGKLRDFVACDFSTTGPTERAAGDLMVMDAFQAYFEYEMRAGCGIPRITLQGTVADWQSIRNRAALFAEFGLETWAQALDPILEQFVAAAAGKADREFWRSFFRYQSGSGPSIMTGWINVLFPYLRDESERLNPNPYLPDWKTKLQLYEAQDWRERSVQLGGSIHAVPPAVASAPVKIIWGDRETQMLFVGGLLGVSQREDDLALEVQCGWAVVYDEPMAPLTGDRAWLEAARERRRKA